MSLRVSSNTFSPAPEGTHLARCVRIIDLGLQNTVWGTKEQVWIEFELVGQPVEGANRNHSISRFYTKSLSRKAALRADIEGWRGRSLSREEAAGLDLVTVAARPCQITVAHVEKDGVTRAEIRGISALPRGLEVPAASVPLFIFDMDSRDKHALDDLPDWLRDIVLRAKEWETPPPKSAPATPDFDDDIPFG